MDSNKTLCPDNTFSDLRWIAPILFVLPLFLFYPGFTSLYPYYNAAFFTEGAFSILAAGMILLSTRRLRTGIDALPFSILLPGLILFLIATAHFLANGRYSLIHFGQQILCLSIPLFVYLYHKEILKIIPALLLIFWSINLGLSLMQHFCYKTFVFGLPGNINWNAALLVMSTPFTLIYAERFIRRLICGSRYVSWGIAGILILAPSLWILRMTESRGAVLSLFLVLLVTVALHLNGKWKKLFLLGILLASIGIFVFLLTGTDLIAEILIKNERAILLSGSWDMLMAKPLSGYGMASFEEEFLRFCPVEYYFHPYCAVRTNHPHNHFIFMALAFGIIGFLAYLALLFQILIPFGKQYREKSLELKILYLILIYALFHSMLDLILYVYPTNILAFMISGLLLGELIPPEQVTPVSQSRFTGILLKIMGVTTVCAALFITGREALAEHYLFDANDKREKSEAFAEESFYKAGVLSRTNERLLYKVMVRAMNSWKDYDGVCFFYEKLAATPIENYAHAPGYMGVALYDLKRPKEALQYLKKDSENYPFQIVPHIQLSTVYLQLGMTEEFMKSQERIRELMKIRNVTPEDIPLLLENQDLDLRPWTLPEEKERRARQKTKK